jgi:hypothetical protein
VFSASQLCKRARSSGADPDAADSGLRAATDGKLGRWREARDGVVCGVARTEAWRAEGVVNISETRRSDVGGDVAGWSADKEAARDEVGVATAPI